jgi:hypothetical protein
VSENKITVYEHWYKSKYGVRCETYMIVDGRKRILHDILTPYMTIPVNRAHIEDRLPWHET